jgi:hypothetical protein
MRRDKRRLSTENAAADADAQLRRRLERVADAELRAERVEQIKQAEINKIRSHLGKWKNENISSASNFTLTEPVAAPNGAQFWCTISPHFVLILFFSPVSL